MSIGSKITFLPESSMAPFHIEQLSIANRSTDAIDGLGNQESSPGWTLEYSAFHELLKWLGPDPETAGQQYEFIRQKLIALFRRRTCVFPDELADETINRVVRKLPQIKSSYVGSPARYFCGVAKKVYLESLRPGPVQKPLPAPCAGEDLEELFQRLEIALGRLKQSDRELVLCYYQEGGRRKIGHRKDLAKKLGVSLNTLRLRVYRIRFQLRRYLMPKD
jgi:DNA-directed RNA polymerase specialized sigma24 family protein